MKKNQKSKLERFEKDLKSMKNPYNEIIYKNRR